MMSEIRFFRSVADNKLNADDYCRFQATYEKVRENLTENLTVMWQLCRDTANVQ